jgi:hypothetical protein
MAELNRSSSTNTEAAPTADAEIRNKSVGAAMLLPVRLERPGESPPVPECGRRRIFLQAPLFMCCFVQLGPQTCASLQLRSTSLRHLGSGMCKGCACFCLAKWNFCSPLYFREACLLKDISSWAMYQCWRVGRSSYLQISEQRNEWAAQECRKDPFGAWALPAVLFN